MPAGEKGVWKAENAVTSISLAGRLKAELNDDAPELAPNVYSDLLAQLWAR